MRIFTIRNNTNIIEQAYIRFYTLRIRGRLLTRRGRNCNIN